VTRRSARDREFGTEDDRSDARERALILLYEAESKSIAPSDVVEAQVLVPDDLTRAWSRACKIVVARSTT
jgi:transcription termination factor NusB